MRTSLFATLVVAAALLTGCQGSGEQHKDYVPMPDDMNVNIWDVDKPAKALAPTQAAPTPAAPMPTGTAPGK
jgi:hypothetical protein